MFLRQKHVVNSLMKLAPVVIKNRQNCKHVLYVIFHYENIRTLKTQHLDIVGEPKSRIVQKHTFFAPERYTAGILYTDSLNGA